MAEDDICINAVVIDQGYGTIKAGRAGDPAPSIHLPCVVGCPKVPRVLASHSSAASIGRYASHQPSMTLAAHHHSLTSTLHLTSKEREMCRQSSRELYVGEEALTRRAVLNLLRPFQQDDADVDSQVLEALWDDTFRRLDVDPTTQKLLVAEPIYARKSFREKLAIIAFDELDIEGLFLSLQATLALYATGRVSGVVLDLGDNRSVCVPVVDGAAVIAGIMPIDVGGRAITDRFEHLLAERGITLDEERLRRAKEKHCYVRINEYNGPPDPLNNSRRQFLDLPDGSLLELRDERWLAPELLFSPLHLGAQKGSLPAATIKSLEAVGLRSLLVENLILSGGSSLFDGLPERLKTELGKTSALASANVRIVVSDKRDLLPWIGGSILASLPSFQRMWIDRDDFLEVGPQIVHRRCY